MMGLDIGAQFKQYGELRFGLMRGELRPNWTPGRNACRRERPMSPRGRIRVV